MKPHDPNCHAPDPPHDPRQCVGRLIWSGRAPTGASLLVRKDERGLWHVVHDGFRRCTSRTLSLALTEALALRATGRLARSGRA